MPGWSALRVQMSGMFCVPGRSSLFAFGQVAPNVLPNPSSLGCLFTLVLIYPRGL